MAQSWGQGDRITWPKRLSFITLTLGCLLLINAALFTNIAHATPTATSVAPDYLGDPVQGPPTSATTSPTSELVATSQAKNTPTPTPPLPPPPPPPSTTELSFAHPQGLGLTVVAFGSLLLLGMVFIVRIPSARTRRRDEHDE